MKHSPVRTPRMALALLAIALMLCYGPPRRASAGAPTAPDFAAIDSLIEARIRELRIPGLAVAIVQGGQIAHLKGFGVTGPDRRPVTAQTPFQLASIVKPMTGVAVMQLVEAGQLDLDAPVQRYLPWFRVADAAASAQITPRHLLYHTSGLPAAVGTEYAFGGDARPDALRARVRELRTVQLSRSPGEAYEYSNAGYMVLGLLIQEVSGQPYGEYMHQHLFAPLHMRHTFTDWAEARQSGAATGHRSWFGIPLPGQLAVDQAMLPAGGSLSGSAEDVAHFLIAQLNGGRFGSATLLSAEGIALMQRPVFPAGGADAYHAMDWGIGPIGGELALHKGGDLSNFKSQLVLFPERRLGLVVLMNTNRQLNGALGDLRLPMLAYNVAELLVAQPPTAASASPIPPLLYVALIAVIVLQGANMARTLIQLRRWHLRPELRSQSRAALALRLGLPLLANLSWGALALVGIPAVFRAPFSFGLYAAPDLFSVLLVSGSVALIWAPVRAALLWRRARERPAAGAVMSSGPA